jgi:SAM-dependent methyltransferase
MGDYGSTATVPEDVAAKWLERWDAQQERYVADREERFAVICDVVESALENVAEPVVLDLGCGPGSLAARLHERLPKASVIGIDSDPLLLGLARIHYRGDIEWIDADLAGTAWCERVPATIHAAVSTTALHWLSAGRLAELYRIIGTLMAPGGVLVNGDHLRSGDERINALTRLVRDRRAERAGVLDNEEWRPWWDAILADPNLQDWAEARARRIAVRDKARAVNGAEHNGNNLSVGEHADLLRAAGFGSVAPVWQVGDDHVLAAVR